VNPDPLEPARLVRGLLRMYPAEWRERFADEFAAVLVAVLAGGARRRHPGRLRIVLDVAAGAVDAHIHRSFQAGRKPMPDRVRTSAQVAFCAFVLFCVAGTGFQKMTEDLRFQAVARTHAALGWSFGVVVYGAIAAAVFVAAGSLPVLLAIGRQALAGRRDLRRLLILPPAAVIAWVGIVFGVTRLDQSPRHSPANFAAFVLVVVALQVAAALSAGALVIASRRAELPARIKRAQWVPMSGLSVAMVAVTVGDLVWGLSLHAQAPGLFRSDNGLLATSLPVTWVSTLAVMGLASAIAVAATVRAIGAVRGGEPPHSAGLISPVS
jgi:hypothetical protein